MKKVKSIKNFGGGYIRIEWETGAIVVKEDYLVDLLIKNSKTYEEILQDSGRRREQQLQIPLPFSDEWSKVNA